MNRSEGGVDANGTVNLPTVLKRVRKLEGFVERLSKRMEQQQLAIDDLNELVIALSLCAFFSIPKAKHNYSAGFPF